MLQQDAKGAHRSPHLRKASVPGVDTIDALDTVPGGGYHHEGPFDATLASRNMNSKISPVAAVAGTNALALEATPPEMIREALVGHRPLDGVAVVPSGERDKNGRVYEYEENNLMEGLGKWSGVVS
jgi:Pal1 cell morphology protein